MCTDMFLSCATITGEGTVMSGTVLSGSAKVGDSIELPELKVWLVPLMNSVFCIWPRDIAHGLCCLMILPVSLVVSADCQRPFLDSRCRPQTSSPFSLLIMTLHFTSTLLSCTVDIVWQASSSVRELQKLHSGGYGHSYVRTIDNVWLEAGSQSELQTLRTSDAAFLAVYQLHPC